ncbi:hypothetical protein [Mycolicibacterium komossense]|uniref:hypothetical protein n=1 Tax=Mycolicibacterium komossense TaxID=1779 RepID=UPI0021F3836A|nr:hypothetical protein [Mycolicibacterium komossense]
MALRTAVANLAVFGAVAVGAAVASMATAAADPPPPDPALLPVDPAAPAPAPEPPPPPGPSIPVLGAPLGPAGFNILAQNGSEPRPGALGVPQTVDTSPQALLGQNQIPSAPGQGVPGAPINLDPINNAYVMPQNEKPAAPGQGTQVGVAPGEENDHLGRIDYLKQWHDLYKNGNLKGALLGQAPQEQLGQPLPGTAPPPGTNIPPGLEQYLPDPAAPPAPVDPAAPILPVVPPPPAG